MHFCKLIMPALTKIDASILVPGPNCVSCFLAFRFCWTITVDF